MKHLQLFSEIDSKLKEMLDEALKYAGTEVLTHVNNFLGSLSQILNYRKPPEAPPSQPASPPSQEPTS